MNGGAGEHGTPALKDVTGARRTQAGLMLRKPRMEGVPVLGSIRGPKSAMYHPVQVSILESKGQPLLSKKHCIPRLQQIKQCFNYSENSGLHLEHLELVGILFKNMWWG